MPNGTQKGELLRIPLENITLSKKNIRTELPNASDLRVSIETQGLLEPVLVRKLSDGKWELVGGFRRYLAVKQLKHKDIAAHEIIATDAEVIRIQLIENLQREDMNPYDIAIGIQLMLEAEKIDQKQAAVELGKTEGFISQHLSLLKMTDSVKKAVKNGKLGIAHVRILGKLKTEEAVDELVELASGKAGEGARMTTDELANKVKFINDKEEKKEAEKVEKQRAKTRAKAESGGEAPPEEEKKPTLVDLYEQAKVDPMSKTELKQLLKEYADKYENARSEDKKLEYKNVLKGIELAGRVEK